MSFIHVVQYFNETIQQLGVCVKVMTSSKRNVCFSEIFLINSRERDVSFAGVLKETICANYQNIIHDSDHVYSDMVFKLGLLLDPLRSRRLL
jgi:hypothetical protein